MTKYFVSYNFVDEKGCGFGDCEFTLDSDKKFTFSFINEIRKAIKETGNFKSVTLINIIKLEDE